MHSPWPFLDHPAPIPFAHQGGAREAPENTLDAFARAVELGYRWVETDVRATADGKLVAFHDPTLDRATDRTGRIEDLRWSEVSRAVVGDGGSIPLLEDVLAAFPDVRVNIDPKSDGAAAPLAEAIVRTGAVDRVCVGSFSDTRTARVRRLLGPLGPRLCTALGPAGVTGLRLASYGVSPLGWLLGAACAQVPASWGRVPIVDRRFVDAAHGLGLAVHVWTVDDEPTMHRLLDLGVDGIMTDRPAALKQVFVERGIWVD